VRAPRVLVTTRREMRRGRAIQFVGEAHLALLAEAGAIPVPVPALAGAVPLLDELIEEADGLLLVEGGDIAPEHRPVAPERLSLLEELDPDKDVVDLGLLRRALARDLPVLGICRGAELLNLAAGGTLYDDLGTELGTGVAHVSRDDYDGHRHPVTLDPDAPLARIYGAGELMVSSYHHQGVRELAGRLRPMAVASDGLVEAFHDPSARFVWGLQFHPERQLAEHVAHGEVHRALAVAAHDHATRRDDTAHAHATPRVLVPMRRDLRKGRPIQFVHEEHLELLLGFGALPQPVPSIAPVTTLADALLDEADGLLLVEGGDIGADRHEVRPDRLDRLREVDADRDAVEFALAEGALERDLPVLATCRGAQVVNVLAGGSLHADVHDDLDAGLRHVDRDRYDDHRHPIEIAPGTVLAEIYGDAGVVVTSVHHQGVDRLAERFRPIAWAPDGLVEAFEDPACAFLLAIQYHPERQLGEHPGHAALYQRLAAAAAARAAERDALRSAR
jgi:gamma-glutamyl-gamma-aminobutyrate hydrolase PuuD